MKFKAVAIGIGIRAAFTGILGVILAPYFGSENRTLVIAAAIAIAAGFVAFAALLWKKQTMAIAWAALGYEALVFVPFGLTQLDRGIVMVMCLALPAGSLIRMLRLRS